MKPGRHLVLGNDACAEGAIRAGCRLFAGYPITPANEISHYMAAELPKAGGFFLQMEDEIASIAAVIGASWAGAKAMTATSGPGYSLMQENIGYAHMTEASLVLVNVQRSGPSTGQATLPSQSDVYQAKYGAHGDYEVVALSPWSVQEMFDLTVRAFNLAERFRTPVMLMADKPAQESSSLYTTFDREFQREVQDILDQRAGAIAVLEADTGRVLALATYPTFDPRPFATGIAIITLTFLPPPDSPKIVTLPGSPPKVSMLSRTHSRASTASSIPLMPEAAYSAPAISFKYR